MSTLQIGLLVIAAVAVAGVYLYNLFEERRIKRRIDGAFKKPEDVLLATPAPAAERRRREPTLSSDDDAVVVRLSNAAVEQATGAPEPPRMVETPVVAEAAPAGDAEVRQPDAMIECLAQFEFDPPVAGCDIVNGASSNLAASLTWYARTADGENWRVLASDTPGEFGELCCGLQLANRQGPMSRAQLDEFLDRMNALARQRGAALMSADAATEAARADALDQACAAVDVQVGLSLLRRESAPIAGTKLRGVAEGSGFRLNASGRFVYVNEESGKPMFELADVGGRPLAPESLKSMQFSGITLILDLPRVHEPLRAFDQMRAMSKRLANMMEASLVDDARRPLSDAALATIRDQLQQTCAAMRDMNVEPGSARALRLFS